MPLPRASHRLSRRHQKSPLRQRITRFESLESRLMFAADLGSLTHLNDEFNDHTSREDWQLVSEVEGWGAQHFEVFDIDQTTPGALTIAPHTSTWYQDYQGDLAFKEVTGDFVVNTHVAISDRDDIGGSDTDDLPSDSTFSLGGIMLRTPRDMSDAVNEWTPGGANFVFLSLGYGYQGDSFSLESKTTRNSVSNLELMPIDQNNVELEISRVGATITTRYRLAGNLDWHQAEVFDRPDMPETVQVGLVGYTDYAKAATFSPFYANSNTLVDSPENAAASSNANQPYNPDLVATFDYIRFERPNADDTSTVTSSEFPQVGDQQLRPGETLSITLPAALENHVPIQYTVNVPSMELWNLDQTYGLQAGGYRNDGTPLYYEHYADYGVKWLRSDIEGWMFLQSNGNLRNWQGSLDSSPLIATLDPVLFDDPSALHDAQETVTATIENGSLTITPAAGFVGSATIALSSTAGDLSQTETFHANVTNTTPILPAIGPQTVSVNATWSINLPTSDPDGDLITYAIDVVENIATEIRETHQITADENLVAADYGYNYLGQQERWVQSAAGWMYITPEGAVHLWNGNYANSPQVSHLDSRYHQDPNLLVQAEHVDVTTTVTEGQLQLSVQNYVGQLAIRLRASDGVGTSTQDFSLLVTALPWENLVDAAFAETL